MAASIEQLSFELSTSALEEQERALAGLRTRAGTILAAGSVAGSFLGARAGRGSLNAWTIVAMTSFVLCVGSAIWILLPHEFRFAFRGEDVRSVRADRRLPDVTAAYRAAGTWIERHQRVNSGKLAGLADWLTMSCVLLAVEVVSSTLSLAG